MPARPWPSVSASHRDRFADTADDAVDPAASISVRALRRNYRSSSRLAEKRKLKIVISPPTPPVPSGSRKWYGTPSGGRTEKEAVYGLCESIGKVGKVWCQTGCSTLRSSDRAAIEAGAAIRTRSSRLQDRHDRRRPAPPRRTMIFAESPRACMLRRRPSRHMSEFDRIFARPSGRGRDLHAHLRHEPGIYAKHYVRTRAGRGRGIASVSQTSTSERSCRCSRSAGAAVSLVRGSNNPTRVVDDRVPGKVRHVDHDNLVRRLGPASN